jgi:hypothetical protein
MLKQESVRSTSSSLLYKIRYTKGQAQKEFMIGMLKMMKHQLKNGQVHRQEEVCTAFKKGMSLCIR